MQPNLKGSKGKNDNKETAVKLSWIRVFISVCSAFFGVQSDIKRREDFANAKLWPFIITGLVVVFVFVLLLIYATKLILFLAV